MPLTRSLLCLAATLFCVAPAAAWATQESPCGELSRLEDDAMGGRLTAPTTQCLERSLADASPEDQARMSVILIIQAYGEGDSVHYEALLKRHLATIHTTDADVAYMYAALLRDQNTGRHDELVHWANVALDNRQQWAERPERYHDMVRSLYTLRNEAAMARGAELQQTLLNAPSPLLEAELQGAARRARYYLAVSGPCLVKGECGPRFEVALDEAADCHDLDELERLQRGHHFDEQHATCLQWHYPKQAGPRQRALNLILRWAQEQASAEVWERLAAWYLRTTQTQHPVMALHVGQAQLAQGAAEAPAVLQLVQAALADAPSADLAAWPHTVEQLRGLATRAAELANACPPDGCAP